MVGIPAGILGSLVQLPQEPRLALAHMAVSPRDLAPQENPPFGTSAIAFQYWPEQLTDNRSPEWIPKNIPGGSHPIYQWTHGGERPISFSAIFTTDQEPDEIGQDISDFEVGSVDIGGYTEISGRDRSLDIRSMIAWLRYFTYPYYGRGNDLRVFEPPKVLLIMPNMKLGHQGGDGVSGVITQCDVVYEACFPSGYVRTAEVSLTIMETVQDDGAFRFHNRRDMRHSAGAKRRRLGDI